MPIGIVSDSDFDSELIKSNSKTSVSQSPRVTAEVLNKLPIGRGENNVAVPESIQKLIGETSLTENRPAAIKLAKHFGISESSAAAYSNGAASTSSYNNPKPELRKNIDKTKERIGKKASNRLVMALDSITEDKLKDASLKVASSVARDMAAVMKDMEPTVPKNEGEGNKVQFVIYAPQIKTEEAYDTIVVSE